MLIEKQAIQVKNNTLKQLRFALTAFCSQHTIENAENKSLKQELASGLITHSA